jgi:hypothetical protein
MNEGSSTYFLHRAFFQFQDTRFQLFNFCLLLTQRLQQRDRKKEGITFT